MTKYFPSIGFIYLASIATLIIAGLLWIAEPLRHEYIKLANVAFAQGNYLEAVRLYDKARDRYDTNVEKSNYYKLAANAYFSAKRYHNSFDYLINATILEPDNLQTKQALQKLIVDVKQVEPLALSQFKEKLRNYQQLDGKTKAEIIHMLDK